MATTNVNLETAPAHAVLAAAGKTKLRPGGVAATEQLFEWANFQPNETVLELAASFGESAIAIAKRFGVRVMGIEKDPNSVAKAQERIQAEGLEDKVEIRQGDIFRLDELSEQFDYVLAEAILTMQSPSGKAKILQGISQRLKTGGKFLSHELLAKQNEEELHKLLAESNRVNATPLSESHWKEALKAAGLEVEKEKVGNMGLLNLNQMIRDEGALRTLKIVWNISTNPIIRKRVLKMRDVYQNHSDDLGYIVLMAIAK
ncbi:MAG: SAM-dependent methyltransferase [Halothece sp.]